MRTLNQIKIVQDLFEIQRIISFDSISSEELKKRIISRGRGEDPSMRINDYLKKIKYCSRIFLNIL